MYKNKVMLKLDVLTSSDDEEYNKSMSSNKRKSTNFAYKEIKHKRKSMVLSFHQTTTAADQTNVNAFEESPAKPMKLKKVDTNEEKQPVDQTNVDNNLEINEKPTEKTKRSRKVAINEEKSSVGQKNIVEKPAEKTTKRKVTITQKEEKPVPVEKKKIEKKTKEVNVEDEIEILSIKEGTGRSTRKRTTVSYKAPKLNSKMRRDKYGEVVVVSKKSKK